MVTLNLTAPASWGALTQEQLSFLLRTIVTVNRANSRLTYRSAEDFAAQSAAQVALYCLLRWNGVSVVTPYADAWLVARGGREYVVSAADLAAATSFLSWIGRLPDEPVRLDRIGGSEAVAADLDEGFSFDDWLACEALWQSYQMTTDDRALTQMAALLYHDTSIDMQPHEVLSIFYWWSGVKALCNRLYPHFFQPAPAADGAPAPDRDSLRRNMDSQIRALTKGDITKEEQVLAMPVHRALTELDALAREYEELNRKYPATK